MSLNKRDFNKFILKFKLDAECYDLFSDLFHPVIGDYHKVDVKTLKQVNDMGDPSKIDDLKPEDQACVRSTRTRVGRTVRGFAMANKLTREVKRVFDKGFLNR